MVSNSSTSGSHQPFRFNKTRLPTHLSTITLNLLLYLPLILKAIYVEKFIYKRSMQLGVGSLQVLAHDAVIYTVLIMLFVLGFTVDWRHFIIRMVLRLALLSCLVIYVSDLFIIKNFNTHLVLNDVVKYINYTPQYISELSGGLSFFSTISICVVSSVTFYLLVVMKTIDRKRVFYLGCAVCMITLSLKLIVPKTTYVHSWIYQDLISYNRIIYSESVDYSVEFKAKLSKYNPPQPHCEIHSPQSPAIILLMVESLSAYQSAYFSGIKDWTPRLDQIAQKHFALKELHANGFTTEDGEIALLTGQAPLYRPASFTNGGGASFQGFFQAKESLPNLLKARGYHTSFLTTSDLSFSNTKAWAQSIGFNKIEGHEHPSYNKWPRFQFKSAPDKALMERILSYVDERQQFEQPWFIFSKTVTSHHPFINPKTGVKSEEQTIRYVDQQIGMLYEELNKRQFFKNGLLIIVGDHHAMVPVRQKEVDQWGAFRATARIPGVIVSDQHLHTSDQQLFQQVDIQQGLVNLTSNQRCVTQWRGDAISIPPIHPKWIIHRRGDLRNKVSVFTQAHDYLIELNGDQTRDISLPPNEHDQLNEAPNIIEHINWLRIK